MSMKPCDIHGTGEHRVTCVQCIAVLNERWATWETRAKEAEKKIDAWRRYATLLTEELNEVVGLATLHGWKSTRAEQGAKFREELGLKE